MLNRYDDPDTYTDCYRTEFIGAVTHEEFVAAFYTTWLFKCERAILKWTVSRPSSDVQAAQLANGSIDTFAAWAVEDRCENQILLADFQGRTRSWLMVARLDAEGVGKTQLYFGSAVTPVKHAKTGRMSLGLVFSMLLGFHRCYSVALLYSARSKLGKSLR